ncbi:MAG: KOW domain-containing RNA-binding protein [Bacillota bacterium]
MVDLKPGQLVRSLAGRDKGKHYLVLEKLDHKHVLLVDGRSRPIARPKKKNIVHLQHYERRAESGDLNSINDNQVISYLNDLIPENGTPSEEV